MGTCINRYENDVSTKKFCKPCIYFLACLKKQVELRFGVWTELWIKFAGLFHDDVLLFDTAFRRFFQEGV